MVEEAATATIEDRPRARTRRPVRSPWARAASELGSLAPTAQLTGGAVAVAAAIGLVALEGPVAAALGLTGLVLAAGCWALARAVLVVEQTADEERRITEQVTLVVEQCPDAFVSVDARGRVRAWNARAEKMFGWTREEALGRDVADLVVPPKQRDAHRNGLERYVPSADGPESGRRTEITAWHRKGAEFPVELVVSPAGKSDAGQFNAFFRDLSGSRRIELERAELAGNMQVLLETSTEGIFEVDLDGRWTFLNASAATMLGLDAALAIGMDACSVLHRSADVAPHDDTTCFIQRSLQWGSRLRAEHEELWGKDGPRMWADCRTYPSVFEGQIQGLIVVFTPQPEPVVRAGLGDRVRFDQWESSSRR
jgi:PAS domain S-box-containing protein